MGWLSKLRKDYKANDPEGYARSKDRGRFFGLGAVVVGIIIVVVITRCT